MIFQRNLFQTTKIIFLIRHLLFLSKISKNINIAKINTLLIFFLISKIGLLLVLKLRGLINTFLRLIKAIISLFIQLWNFSKIILFLFISKKIPETMNMIRLVKRVNRVFKLEVIISVRNVIKRIRNIWYLFRDIVFLYKILRTKKVIQNHLDLKMRTLFMFSLFLILFLILLILLENYERLFRKIFFRNSRLVNQRLFKIIRNNSKLILHQIHLFFEILLICIINWKTQEIVNPLRNVKKSILILHSNKSLSYKLQFPFLLTHITLHNLIIFL